MVGSSLATFSFSQCCNFISSHEGTIFPQKQENRISELLQNIGGRNLEFEWENISNCSPTVFFRFFLLWIAFPCQEAPFVRCWFIWFHWFVTYEMKCNIVFWSWGRPNEANTYTNIELGQVARKSFLLWEQHCSVFAAAPSSLLKHLLRQLPQKKISESFWPCGERFTDAALTTKSNLFLHDFLGDVSVTAAQLCYCLWNYICFHFSALQNSTMRLPEDVFSTPVFRTTSLAPPYADLLNMTGDLKSQLRRVLAKIRVCQKSHNV